MRCNAVKASGVIAVCLGALLFAATAPAAGIDDFKLTRAIPADAALAVHARDHEGRAFLNQQFERVWAAVERQHFERDLRTLIKSLVLEDGGDPEAFEQWWQELNDLLMGVEWCSLFEDEFAYAMKMGFPMPDFIVLGTASPEKAAANFAGLERILQKLVSQAPEGVLVVASQGSGDSIVHTVNLAEAPFPIGSLLLAREKNTLLIGLGQTMPEQALALLRGEEGQTLAGTARFISALKRLPPPQDEIFFWDLTRFMGQFRAWAEAAMSMASAASQPATQPAEGEGGLDPLIKALPAKIIEQLDMIDYLAEVSSTEGLKTTSHSVAVLRDEAQSTLLYKVFCSNGAVSDPLKFIPQDAQNFSVWSGVNLKALYDGILAFVGKNAPGGEGLLAQWEETKATLPVDIEADILSWVGGGIQTFSMPAKSAYQPGDWALMLTVRDEAKAREVLGRLFAEIEPRLTEASGALHDAEIPGAEGFKVVVHPALAMMAGLGQPTLGVKDGQLFLGSGPKVIQMALATAAGETPNFSQNERFQKEGLRVDQNVMALSFSDLTRLGEELGQALMMVPMIGMVMPDLTQNPVGRAFISAASKAGRVVRELNFFQSSCSQTTFDGKVILTQSVLTYREPPAPEPPPAEETPESEAEEPSPAEEPGGGGGEA